MLKLRQIRHLHIQLIRYLGDQQTTVTQVYVLEEAVTQIKPSTTTQCAVTRFHAASTAPDVVGAIHHVHTHKQSSNPALLCIAVTIEISL